MNFNLNTKSAAKFLLVPLFSLTFSNVALAGACGSGNKDDFYEALDAKLSQGGNIVLGYQNCGGYTVDKVKFYLRVDGDNMWSITKTGDLKINEYHIVTLAPGSIGAKVRAALAESGDNEVQLRTKIWIRAGDKKSQTKNISYNKFVAWGTNSDGTTTKGNRVSTKHYQENGYHSHFMNF